MISLTIDGKAVQVQEGATLLQAAGSLDIRIPTLCYHPLIKPFAACRLCLVEVKTRWGEELVPSCHVPCQQGMLVSTNSKHVLEARRFVLELMLARWPNVPVLRKLAEELGVKQARFSSVVRDEREDACILCGLCVRACDEVVGASAISFAERGIQRHVATPFNLESETCIACGVCALVCPTSHIKFEAEEYKGKPPEFMLGPNTAV
jgi:bidirectional [NiFe] hydrogenase diaphorase subunit